MKRKRGNRTNLSKAVDKTVTDLYNVCNPPGDSISGLPPTETWDGPFKGVLWNG